MYPLRFLLFVLLPLTVYGQVPAFTLNGVHDSATGNTEYLVALKLAHSPSTRDPPEDLTEFHYLLDTNAHTVTLSSNNCTRKTELWTFIDGDGSPVASTSHEHVANLDFTCTGKRNVAGIRSSRTSLPVQVSKAVKRPLRFGYLLRDLVGSLWISKTVWIQFISIAPEVKEDIRFVEIPMKVDDPVSGYLVKLTGAEGKKKVSYSGDYVEISTTHSFTTLPPTVYSFILGEFQRDVEGKKIKPAGTGYGNLKLCYKMRSTDVKRFGNVTMVFNGNRRWSVSAESYLVPKPNTNNVFCFAYLEAGSGARGVIGTLQQMDRAVEFHLEKKLLRVSPPLFGSLSSP